MWQVLRACRERRAALGYGVHHGPGALVHYSTAPAAAPVSSRSFCLSREKATLQGLNRRLASYLQQVKCLEAANQKLERQIQEALDKKCPSELKELDGYLKKASVLQDQIGECLSAQAQVKLQLLTAELTSLDLSTRCEKERESRSRVEGELSDLRQLEVEIKFHKIPELQSLLDNHSQQLMQLQVQHQQDMQGLLAQVSGDAAVEIHTTDTSDLIQQLDQLRQTSMALMNKHQDELWFSAQGSMLSSEEVAYNPAGEFDVDQAELGELRRTAASFEAELTQLQTMNRMLEASGAEQNESFVLLLDALQDRADGLCIDLDLVLQAAAHQAADHQDLLDIKSRLEREINDYKKLLDGMSQPEFSGLRSFFVNNSPSFSTITSPPAFRRKIKMDKTVSVQREKLRMNQIQAVSGEGTHIVKKPPLFGSIPETMDKGQTTKDIRQHTKSHIVGSVNISNLKGSFHKSENKKTEAQLERNKREATTIVSAEANNQSIPVDVHPKDPGPQNSTTFGSEIRQSLEDNAVFKDLKVEQRNSTTALVPGKPFATDATGKEQSETLNSNQTTVEAREETSFQEVVISSTDSDNLKPVEIVDEPVGQPNQEALLMTTNSKKSTVRADSGVGLSSSSTEELLSPVEGHIFLSPSKPDSALSPDICLSPVETEVLMGVTDQVFCPVDRDIRSPDSLLSPDMFLSPNDSCLSSNFEDEDEEACLIPAEATMHVRPVEKYVLTTKEESQSLSFSGDQALPDGNRNKRVSITVRDSDSVCFGSSEDNAENRTKVNGSNVNDKPTFQEVASHPGGVEFSDSGKCSAIADKEKQLGFGGLYRRKAGNASCPSKRPSGTGDIMNIQNQGGSPGGTHGLDDQNGKTVTGVTESLNGLATKTSMDNDPVSLSGMAASGKVSDADAATKVYANGSGRTSNQVSQEGPSRATLPTTSLPETGRFGRKGSGQWMAYGSLGRSNSLDDDMPKERKEEGPSMRANSATGSEEVGRIGSKGSGEWMKYGGSLGRSSRHEEARLFSTSPAEATFGSAGTREGMVQTSSQAGSDDLLITERRESRPSALQLATSLPETGRFGRRGSGEWMVYGSLGRRSSLDSGASLEGEEEGPSVAMTPATGPQETGRFCGGRSGERVFYSGSLGHKSSRSSAKNEDAMLLSTSPPENSSSIRYTSSQAGSNAITIAGKRENQTTTLQLATSPTETGRFGSRGSGEWRVYGGCTGRISSWARSSSLPNADGNEGPLADIQRSTSPADIQLSTSPPAIPITGRFVSGGSGEWRVYGGSTGRMSSPGSTDEVSANCRRVISPPSSRSSSSQRFGSAGSGGRLSLSSVVRRSSSVGSGGRLSGSSGVRYASTGSGELKPVYSSASGRKSSAGSGGLSGGVAKTSSQRAPSPGGKMSSSPGGGWLSSSTAGGNPLSSSGSGSKLSSTGSNDRISSKPGGQFSNSSGSGRANSTGGRVISSSSRSNRSTGSGAGSSKERISVCKMAALSISAAKREKSRDKKSQTQKSQQAGGTSPLLQRWLNGGAGVTSADSEGLDDIMRL